MSDAAQTSNTEASSESAAAQAQERRLQSWLIVGASIFLTCLLLVSHPPYSDARDYVGYALRVTAWLSFSFFIVAYAARPMLQLFDSGWRQQFARFAVQNRRYFGLGAAFVHTVHFGYVVVFALATPVAWSTIVFGGLAFVLLWAQAVTSNAKAIAALGPRWKVLHRASMHYVWLIYTFTLLGGLQRLSLLSTLLLLVALFAALMRFAAYQRSRDASH